MSYLSVGDANARKIGPFCSSRLELSIARLVVAILTPEHVIIHNIHGTGSPDSLTGQPVVPSNHLSLTRTRERRHASRVAICAVHLGSTPRTDGTWARLPFHTQGSQTQVIALNIHTDLLNNIHRRQERPDTTAKVLEDVLPPRSGAPKSWPNGREG